MCGLAGWIGNKVIPDPEQIKLFEQAVLKLKPRGPDFQYVKPHPGWMLGHTRLSIIDLSECSNQPLTDGKGNYIVFNGEIYNYLELKDDLKKEGVAFFSNGDSEVLLKGLEYYGVDFIKKLKGMFAFAWLNTNSKKLLLCRDRFGVKPLAYSVNENGIQFASNLFPLKILMQDNLVLDENSAALFFMLGYIPSPETAYANIKKVKPASYLTFNLNNDYSIESCKESFYWNIEDIPPAYETRLYKNFEEAQDQYEELVTASVQYRLISDVEVGSLLSGGIDSTMVTLKSAYLTNKNITCFTAGFNDERYDEVPFAKSISDHLNIKISTDYLHEKDVLSVWDKMWNVFDEPFADSSALPMITLSESVRKNFKVALSGDGGDETNGGYPWHKALYKINHLPFSLPTKLVSLAAIFTGKKFRYKLKALTITDRIDQWIYLKTGLVKSQFKHLPFRVDCYELIRKYYETNAKLLSNIHDPFDWAMRMDILTYLPDDLMVKADRASMSVGLELREPLLDHQLVEWCLICPVNYRVNMQNLQSKRMSRKIIEKSIPKSLIDRPKQGFSPPLDKWLNTSLSKDRQKAISSFENNSISNFIISDTNWNDYSRNLNDEHHQFLWRLICYNEWNAKVIFSN